MSYKASVGYVEVSESVGAKYGVGSIPTSNLEVKLYGDGDTQAVVSLSTVIAIMDMFGWETVIEAQNEQDKKERIRKLEGDLQELATKASLVESELLKLKGG